MQWKRSRRRGVSVGRIFAGVLLMAAVGSIVLFRFRPVAPPVEPVGIERIVTPTMDFAEERVRADWFRLAHGAKWGYFPSDLARTCITDGSPAREVYVLTRVPAYPGPEAPALKVTVRLGLGGEAEVLTSVTPTPPFDRRWRAFDESEAEDFRSLLVEGGFLEMTDRSPPGRCDGESLSLESCVAGRYFGVVRDCETEKPALQPLAELIEAFAAGERALDGASAQE